VPTTAKNTAPMSTTAKRSEQLRRVGKSELFVQQLGCGGGGWANLKAPLAETEASINAAFDAGIRLYDTAPSYGFGVSERRLGACLAALPRDQLLINSKVGQRIVFERELDEEFAHKCNGATDAEFASAGIMNPGPRSNKLQCRMVYDYTYDSIKAQQSETLHRLGTSYIDSCVIHNVDQGYHGTALAPPGNVERHYNDLKDGGGFRALEELRAAGEIKAIGAGVNYELRNLEWWEGTPGHTPFEQLACSVADAGDLDFYLLAGPYNEHLFSTRSD
jgi:D-threo-aldose 1-dehydrogenase